MFWDSLTGVWCLSPVVRADLKATMILNVFECHAMRVDKGHPCLRLVTSLVLL